MSAEISLHPFPGTGEEEVKRFEISARAKLLPRASGTTLELQYHIRARAGATVEVIVLPKESAAGQRRDGLWEQTCFEAFLGAPGEPPYYEWNAATSGAWNLYYFQNYRLGMKPVRVLPTTGTLPTVFSESTSDHLFVSCEIPVSLIPPAVEGSRDLSFCLVLETERGITYWSTDHAGEKPDFHLAKSRKIPWANPSSS